jgi:hypothetical protein
MKVKPICYAYQELEEAIYLTEFILLIFMLETPLDTKIILFLMF